MKPEDFEPFVGIRFFGSCKMGGRGKLGTLTATSTGIEFVNAKKNLLLPWDAITRVRPQMLIPEKEIGWLLVATSDVVEFLGMPMTESEYRVLLKLSQTLDERRQIRWKELEGGIAAEVVDATGWAPPVGTKVTITVAEDQIVLFDSESNRFELPAAELSNLIVRSYTKSSGTRMMGGGFGLLGVAEGMAIASLVSRLTAKSTSWVTVSIDSRIGRVVLVALHSSEVATKALFRKVQDRALENSNSIEREAGGGFIDEIERLSSLYEKGMLTTEEFQELKNALIARSSGRN